ncbi:MAG: LytTR family DNA-binding domain-containing protein [Owenweeksia sp.]
MIKVLIVDDEAMAREALHYLLKKFEDVEVLEVFESAIEARKYLNGNSADLIFLDVEMPGLTGMEFLATARNLPEIILTTNNPDYAVEAFEYKVLDFLTKPINFARLSKSLDRYKESLNREPSTREDMFVRSEGKFVRIAFDDLLYAQTMDDYMCLYMKDKSKHIIHSTLSKLEKDLPQERFQKVHRSYLINLSKIVDVDETTVVIEKEVIPVSRAFRPVLKDRLGLK